MFLRINQGNFTLMVEPPKGHLPGNILEEILLTARGCLTNIECLLLWVGRTLHEGLVIGKVIG